MTDDLKLEVKLLRKWEKDLGKIAERLPQIGPRLEPEDLDYIIEFALAVANQVVPRICQPTLFAKCDKPSI